MPVLLILVIAITVIDAAAPDAIVPSSNDGHGRLFSKPLPIFGGDTQQLIVTLMQQYQSDRNDRATRQEHHQQPTDGNIFAQLNSFIQARQRNASDLAGNIVFKYYNT